MTMLILYHIAYPDKGLSEKQSVWFGLDRVKSWVEFAEVFDCV